MTNDLRFRTDSDDLVYRPTQRNRPYYWLFGAHHGKWVLLGPYPTEERAHMTGRHAYEGAFETFTLETKDRARASQEVKAQMLERGIEAGEGEALSQAMQRYRHSMDGDNHQANGGRRRQETQEEYYDPEDRGR